jgi:signal transduction histidine kinase
LAIVAALVILVIGACGGALWFVDSEGRRLIEDQEKQTAASELDLFSEIQADEGREGLIRAVSRRAQLDGAHGVFALRGADGDILAGNLKSWPQGVGDNETWRHIKAAGAWSEIHVASRLLDSGVVALVGHDHAALTAFQSRVIDAVWVAIAIVAVTCLLIATGITTFIMGRVRILSAAAARVSAGDYAARAPGAEDGGPFGDIATAQNDMLDRIEDLVTGLRTVTDSIAHDLRTPLARMRRQIEDGLASDNPAVKQAALEGALTEADKTIATFTGLIDIARAEGGLSRASMRPLNLSQLVTDAYELFEPLAEERNIALTINAGDAHISGHKALLMQAISNLVHNAIKYAPAGGRVEVDLISRGGEVEIVVADNGPGIPAEQRADAVRRFTRVAAADAPEGLGLGLAIVEACARLHRGRLVLEDNSPGLRARLVLAAA